MGSVSHSRELVRTETWTTLATQAWSDEAISSIPWSSMTEYLHTLLALEDLLLAELASKDASTEQVDQFGVSGGESCRGISQVIEQTLGVDDGGKIIRDMIQNVLERLNLLETPSNELHTQQQDGFRVEDDQALLFRQNNLSEMKMVDAMVRDFAANHEIDLRIYALGSKDIAKPFEAVLAMQSIFVKVIEHHTLRALDIASDQVRRAEFFRNFEEAVALADEGSKTYRKLELRDLSIAEQLVVPAWMVIGDMIVSEVAKDREYTYENFLASLDVGTMPGWTPWRNFIPGDYEYSKAMFRVVMDSISADRALIEECVAAVDVPDVLDRGTARITDAAAGVYVEFEREYHVIPEMTLTARGGAGNPAAAELMGSPSLIGFTARMRDTVTGEYVTGTFTWASIGY